jgi:drug/metabolite transporter (DMT)-like permease
MEKQLSKQLTYAIPLVLFSGVCMAIQGGLVKYISRSLAAETIFFGRTFFAFVCVLVYVLPKLKTMMRERKKGIKAKTLFLLRGICGSGSALLFYYSLVALPLSIATMLYLTFPVFVPIISRIWLKTPVVHHLWWGLSIAFIGIVLVLQPMNIEIDWRLLLGLFSGILGACGWLLNRLLHRYESQQKILFDYFCVTLGVALLCFIVRALCSNIVIQRADWFFLCGMGVTGFFFQYCFSLALRYAPARLVTPCTYFSLIFTIIIDRVYWGRNPSFWELMGIGGVVLGVVLIMCVQPPEKPLAK